MAIVYQGNQISIYRNGEPYASYEAQQHRSAQRQGQHGRLRPAASRGGTGQTLRGSIEDARIYDRA